MIPQKATFLVAMKIYFHRITYRPLNSSKALVTFSRINYLSLSILFFFNFCISSSSKAQNLNMVLDENADYHVNAETLGRTPIGGDTIFVESTRTFPLRFQQIEGDSLAPIVVINKGGQVQIDNDNLWGAITFENCKYVKISGAGHPGFKYGFQLSASQCGLGITELSSDFEAEFVKISHDGFFGIYAKKDYGGNPPTPIPVFKNLIIHDCFIEGASEGMYLGETKTPGMEFKHVKIYNNIIINTLRESIQIANMVEDVEIYNNTMINAGLEGAIHHMNNLQIGDNSVANVYNNIITGAPVWGITNMGKGNCTFTNNYIASSNGIFCDNRTVSDSLSPLSITNNFFRNINGSQIIKNYNEINFLTVEDNVYDSDITFFSNLSGSNYTLSNNTLTSVSEIQFTDPINNNYSLAAGTPIEYIEMGAPSGPEFFDYEDPATTPSQLVITPNMIIDSVDGGSVYSPLLLFDEQNLNLEANEHAISNSWKPDYAMNENAYHAIVDLGSDYYISEINLHDMHDSHNFIVEYLDLTGWVTLFIEPCDSYNTWKKHTTDISTRYLRFSMYDSPYASINEITIYGYPIVKESQQIVIDSTMVTDLVSGGSVYSPLFLFDEQELDIEANEHAISQSWKPYYTQANAPYYVTIDLGLEYKLSEVNLHDMNAVFDFEIEYGDGANWSQLLLESCDGFNVWKTHQTNISTRYLRLVMPQSPYAAVNEIIIKGYPIVLLPEPEPDPEVEEDQIVITPGMVTDLVSGGSVYSPQFLFDEQTLNPLVNDKPISNAWKPYYNNINAPYYVTVDLGQEYHVSKFYMHDINNVQDFNVEFDDNGTWSSVFVEPCDSYLEWKMHNTDIDTRYLRLAMLDSPYAAINEILIYGYPTSNSSKQTKNKISDIELNSEININKVQLFPNPVKERLYLQFPEKMIGTNHIRIIDVLGKVIFNKNVIITQDSKTLEFKASQLLSSSGFYIFSLSNEIGEYQTIKFFKE